MNRSKKSKKNKNSNSISISGPVDLRKTKYATSIKNLNDEEIKAYKAKMVSKYEEEEQLRTKPLVKPIPNPQKTIDTSEYDKWKGTIAGNKLHSFF